MTTKSTITALETIVKQQQDEISGLKAVSMALLTTAMGSPLQAQVKFDTLMIENTAEAIANREAEAKAKQLRDNLRYVNNTYKELKEQKYWSLVFMSEDERNACLSAIWKDTITDFELPEGTKRPSGSIQMPDVDSLLERRAVLSAKIDKINPTQAQLNIEQADKRLKELHEAETASSTTSEVNRYENQSRDAKASLARLESFKAELTQVNKMLAEVIAA